MSQTGDVVRHIGPVHCEGPRDACPSCVGRTLPAPPPPPPHSYVPAAGDMYVRVRGTMNPTHPAVAVGTSPSRRYARRKTNTHVSYVPGVQHQFRMRWSNGANQTDGLSSPCLLAGWPRPRVPMPLSGSSTGVHAVLPRECLEMEDSLAGCIPRAAGSCLWSVLAATLCHVLLRPLQGLQCRSACCREALVFGNGIQFLWGRAMSNVL